MGVGEAPLFLGDANENIATYNDFAYTSRPGAASLDLNVENSY